MTKLGKSSRIIIEINIVFYIILKQIDGLNSVVNQDIHWHDFIHHTWFYEP